MNNPLIIYLKSEIKVSMNFVIEIRLFFKFFEIKIYKVIAC